MFIIGTKNTATQSVADGGSISLGETYRRYSRKNCGINTFSNNGNSITLNSSGIYHITGVVESDATLTLELRENDNTLITTSGIVDYYVIVDGNYVLGVPSLNAKTITLVNTAGAEATITSVVLNVDKVV